MQTRTFSDYVEAAAESAAPDAVVGQLDGETVRVPDDAQYVDFYAQDADAGDWALAAARALAASTTGRVVFKPGETYTFKSTWTITSTCTIVATDATLVMAADATLIVVDYAYLNEQSVAAFAVQSVDLSGGTAGTTPVSVITVSNGSVYLPNDIVKVVSNDLELTQDPDDQERIGEFATVSQVTGNDVYLFSVLINTYTTAPRIARMDRTKRFSFSEGAWDVAASATDSWSEPMMTIIGAYKPTVLNGDVIKTQAEVVEFIGCYLAEGKGYSASDLRTSVADTAYGYLFLSYSSYYGEFSGNYCANGRHVWDDGTKSTAAGGDIRYFGAPAYDIVTNNRCMNMQNSGISTHGSGFGHTISNNTIVYGFNGPTGTRRGIALRGHNHHVHGNTVFGGTGYEVFSNYGIPDNCGGHVFENNRYFQNPNSTDSRSAFEATGRAGDDGNPDSIVTALFINNHAVMHSASTSPIYATLADIRAVGNTITAALSGAGASMIEAGASATIDVEGGYFDATGSSGTNQAIFETSSATGVINYRGPGRIAGGADIDAVLNAGGVASTIHVAGLDSDVTFASPTLGTSGGATVTLDYTTNGGRTSGYSVRTPPTLSTGSNAVDLQFRSSTTIYLRLRATTVGCEVNDISIGNIIGQLLIVTSRTDSSQSIVLKNGGTRLSIVSDITLAVGEATQLIWDGTNWVRAS